MLFSDAANLKGCGRAQEAGAALLLTLPWLYTAAVYGDKPLC